MNSLLLFISRPDNQNLQNQGTNNQYSTVVHEFFKVLIILNISISVNEFSDLFSVATINFQHASMLFLLIFPTMNSEFF